MVTSQCDCRRRRIRVYSVTNPPPYNIILYTSRCDLKNGRYCAPKNETDKNWNSAHMILLWRLLYSERNYIPRSDTSRRHYIREPKKYTTPMLVSEFFSSLMKLSEPRVLVRHASS